jgi:hypothetical protein
MTERTLVAVSVDLAPQKAFEGHLFPALTAAGWQVRGFFGSNIDTGELWEEIKDSTVVLSGLASKEENAKPECLALSWAKAANKKIAVFCDTYRGFRRSHFARYREDTDLLFVVNENDAQEACAVFPASTHIVVSGNPTRELMTFPPVSYAESRALIGAESETLVVFVSGSKTSQHNRRLLKKIARARLILVGCPQLGPILIVFGAHPNDEGLKNNPHYYRALADEWNIIVHTKDTISSDKLIPGADLVISSSGSSSDDAAIIAGIPCINYLLEEVFDDRLASEIGAHVPPLADYSGAFTVLGGSGNLAVAMAALLPQSHISSNVQRSVAGYARQLITPRAKGTAAKTMADALTELVA